MLGADIIDHGILHGDTAFIWHTGGIMLGATLVQMGCSVLAIYLGSRTAMALGRELRAETFRHVQRFTTANRHHFDAPTLITRTTNDVTQVQMVVLLTFTVIVNAPIMGIGGVVMAIRQDTQLSLLLLLVVPLLFTLILLVMSALSPRHVIQQQRIDRISTLLREQLTGVRVIRAFRRQGAEARTFDDANTQLRSSPTS
ncbi:ABC transporter permease [Actinobaculum sp. 313]|uniref:ABC transporter permease n=1 Tax=Actinobaculum sp. 313 TaxID=2495645 RepID=UPI0013DDB8DE|nr:ABC transporter permease [Actinobaculum sp. 313]